MAIQTDVAVIGAGPYGLSIAAHLHAAGIECRVYGVPMHSWSRHMPPGMHLKSDPASSSLFAPSGECTLADFCHERHIAYHPYQLPVRLEHFVAYGNAFQQRFVPQVESSTLLALHADRLGHHLSFDRGDTVVARRVVIATGAVPFRHVPSLLAGLPSELASHSSDFGPLERLRGKEIAIVGAGSSALDLAAQLSPHASRVTLLARGRQLQFQPRPAEAVPTSLLRSVWRRLYAPPSHGLGDGWLMRLCADAPWLIHLLPDPLRRAILANTLGPSGAYFVRDQIERSVTVKLARTVLRVQERGGKLLLTTSDRGGARELMSVDHLVAATGYRVNLQRLAFLDEGLLMRLRAIDQAPVLTGSFESSVPGLYFAGLTAARSFGPALRFVQGASHPARRLTAQLCKSLPRRAILLPEVIRDSTGTAA